MSRAAVHLLLRMLGILAIPMGTTMAHAGNLEIRASQRDGKPLVGAVVMARADEVELPGAPPIAAIMDQIDLAFSPDVLVVPVNSSVQFPNSDAVRHQVYSFSSAHRFQLPLYRGKPYPPIVFGQPGVITLGCNIHDNMLAYIVVTDAPLFGRTDASGSWIAPRVPAGRYRIQIWHPRASEAGDIERTVDVGADGSVLEIRLSRALRPAPLEGRPHSWEY